MSQVRVKGTTAGGAVLPVLVDASGRLVTDGVASAAALGDTTANPTATTVGADLMVYNKWGNTWGRAVAASLGIDGTGNGQLVLTTALVYVEPTGTNAVYLARLPRVFKSVTDAAVTAATGVTVWTPAAGKIARVLRGQLSLSVAGQIILGDNAVGTVILRSPKLAAGGVWDFDLGQYGLGLGAANNVLKVDVSATGNVGGWVAGTEE